MVLIADLWNSFWRSRRGASLYVIRPDHMEIAHREHELILDAAARGDAEMAAKAMELPPGTRRARCGARRWPTRSRARRVRTPRTSRAGDDREQR